MIKVQVMLYFEGVHLWQDAPERLSFLRFAHRHTFQVVAQKLVTGYDREVEFYELSHQVEEAIQELSNERDLGALVLGSLSCEMIAKRLKDACNLYSCGVFEESKNGAIISDE